MDKPRGRRIELDPEVVRALRCQSNLTVKEIASRLGVSRSKVQTVLKANQIRNIKVLDHLASIYDVKTIESLYADEGTQAKAAAKIGIDVKTFGKLVRYHGITFRSEKRQKAGRPGEYKFEESELRRLYLDEGLRMVSIAKLYGCSRPVICRNLKRLGISGSSRRNRK